MKKLSLLVAILLVATIGGVYATWNYVGNDQVYHTSNKGVLMSDKVVEGTVGSYSIESNFNQGVIDQNKGDDTSPQSYHKAVLKYELANSDEHAKVRFIFTPNTTAGSEILENGVITYLWFDDGNMQYTVDASGNYAEGGTPTDIFNVTYNSENYITIHPANTTDEALSQLDASKNFKWTKAADGTFYFDFIDEANGIRSMAAVFTLNVFVLDTPSEYDAFKDAIDSRITCYIANKTPTELVSTSSEETTD